MHLLIDARNAIYRAAYVTVKFPNKHPFTVLFGHVHDWIIKHKATHVHVFWDAPRDEVWRRKFYPGYKNRASSNYVQEMSDAIKLCTTTAKQLFNHLNIRQYEKPQMEADDLINAAVIALTPEKVMVVSTDSDMTQLSFRYDHCSIYHPIDDVVLDRPLQDPVLLKALAGDNADSIDGYDKIGPKTAAKLVDNDELMLKFTQTVDLTLLARNLFLVGLHNNPCINGNIKHVRETIDSKVVFDKKLFSNEAMSLKVNGLLNSLHMLSKFEGLR